MPSLPDPGRPPEALGMQLQLLVLSNAGSLRDWALFASSSWQLWSIRCSILPEDPRIWGHAEWRAHPKHVLVEHGASRALSALQRIVDASLKREVISSLPRHPETLELAAAAVGQFSSQWVAPDQGGGVLHSTCDAQRLGGWLAEYGIDPATIALLNDRDGRTALHHAASNGRGADIEYLLRIAPEAAQQCDVLGLNPTALLSSHVLDGAESESTPAAALKSLQRLADPTSISVAPLKEERPALKVVLLGDGGVGKSVWLGQNCGAEFVDRYVPTLGTEVKRIDFQTNKGPIVINVWDCAGQEKLGGLREGYYIDSHGGIVMFDTTSSQSYANASNWIRDLRRIMGDDGPVILCANKVECEEERTVQPSDVDWAPDSYCELSTKSKYQLDLPLLLIIRHFLGADTILTDSPAERWKNERRGDSCAGGSFGAQPATGGFSFGAQPATGGLFGAQPATGGFSFGAQPATGGLFGAQPELAGGFPPDFASKTSFKEPEGLAIERAKSAALQVQLDDALAKIAALEEELGSQGEEDPGQLSNPTLVPSRVGAFAIISGAGPEAGLLLLQRLVELTRKRLGSAYLSDRDAPEVVLLQCPDIGGCPHEDLLNQCSPAAQRVWVALQKAILQVEMLRLPQFILACNTLHIWSDRIEHFIYERGLSTRFLSIVTCVWRGVACSSATTRALFVLGTRVVTGSRSPYANFPGLESLSVRLRDELSCLIEAVKIQGANQTLGARFSTLLQGLAATTGATLSSRPLPCVVILACTELPLLMQFVRTEEIVNVEVIDPVVLVEDAVHVSPPM